MGTLTPKYCYLGTRSFKAIFCRPSQVLKPIVPQDQLPEGTGNGADLQQESESKNPKPVRRVVCAKLPRLSCRDKFQRGLAPAAFSKVSDPGVFGLPNWLKARAGQGHFLCSPWTSQPYPNGSFEAKPSIPREALDPVRRLMNICHHSLLR